MISGESADKKGAEERQVNEGTYDVPWMDEWTDRDIKKWERKYNISITVMRDDNASISGKDSDIKKFVTKELDFEELELEMMGLKESTNYSDLVKINERRGSGPLSPRQISRRAETLSKNISKFENMLKQSKPEGVSSRDYDKAISDMRLAYIDLMDAIDMIEGMMK